MIETSQTVSVACGIDRTWDYAHDFNRWAELMPGYQGCEIEDADNSRWVLKVGVGGMVRTVRVHVTVEQWAGPQRVDFGFKLLGDPVVGRGYYLAAPLGPDRTEMTLHVEVSGSGPMAPMWEAMGGPVLPRLAAGFAQKLKERIEQANGAVPATRSARPAGIGQRLAAWLRELWVRLAGRSQEKPQ